jgi:hypothetical protein
LPLFQSSTVNEFLMMATIIRAGAEGTGEGEYNLKRIGVAIDEAEEDCDHYPPIQDTSEKHRNHF